MDATLLTILEAQGSGRISAAGAASAVKLAGMLGMKKEALSLPPTVMAALGHLNPNQSTRDAVVHGLAASGAIGAVGMGIHGLSAGARALGERYSKKKDLEKILQTFPRLKEYPPEEIELAYNSIRHMNPHIASDPLAGGSLLGQVLRQRDMLDPKTLRMEVDLAGNLLRLRPEDKRIGEEIMRDAASAGMAMGFQEAAKTRDRAMAERFQLGENDKNRSASREQQTQQLRAQGGIARANLDLKKKEMANRAKELAAGRSADERSSKTEHGRRVFLADRLQDFQRDQNLSNQQAQDAREAIKQVLRHTSGPQIPVLYPKGHSLAGQHATDSKGDPMYRMPYISDALNGLPSHVRPRP
jgi:hypothetical protein